MTRQLAKSTLNRLRARLEDERARLTDLIESFDQEREELRLSLTASEHNSDPENMDGGSLAFEMEMDFSKQRNAIDLLEKVNHALERMDEGTYGVCEVSGKPIPVARLEALPYATTVVELADRV
jgi:RNA polymerase-binding transcription factor DksA